MKSIPIIFVHKGNQFFLKHSLEQARIFNSDSDIYLIGDETNKNFKGIQHYLISDFFESAHQFSLNYKHLSSNLYDYELFCFQRWFIIKDFIEKRDITHFLYLDSDVLIYCHVDTVFNNYLDYDFTICDKQAPCTTLFNKKSIRNFCDFVNTLFSEELYLDILTKRHAEGSVISDMTAFELYPQYQPAKVKELTEIHHGACFDDNINIAGIYESEAGRKKIYWIENKPYTKRIENQQLILFYSLHFQGKAKHIMYNYRINSKGKHVGGIFYKIKSDFSFKSVNTIIKRIKLNDSKIV
ncbi:hypothetical protein AGMMS50262_11660 [Bacteroidia bacterium]|nr:hypothetical protein AGMMS50262_11660 [Bacteroidia bacterium]